MKKLSVLLIILLSLTTGVGLGNWLSQEKHINLISGSGFLVQNSDFSPPLAEVISVKNTINSSAFDLQEAFNTVASVATRGVVSIQATVTVANNTPDFFGNDDFLRRFFGIPEQSRPRKSQSQLYGSGFVIDPEGYLLSNNHVVKDAEEIKILFKDNDKTYTASLVGTDPDTDVALLKINQPGPFPYLQLGDSEKVQIGDIAIAIGNPLGLSHTFTTGVISAKGRSGIVGNKYENFIQTDVAINQGNSGGPLLNLNGEVIGINSAIYSQSGGSIGIGFAIPINMAKQVAEYLRRDGKVSRGWMGVALDKISSEVAEALSVPKGSVLISQVIEGSPAEKAGLKAGDVIISFDGTPVKGQQDIMNKVGVKSKGQSIKVGFIRDGKKMTLNVVLGEQEKPEPINKVDTAERSQLGITIRNLSSEEKQELRQRTGVMIESIAPDSPLLFAGVKEGDVILTINKQDIINTEDFNQKLKKIEDGNRVLLQIYRDNAIRYVIIKK